MHEYSIIKTLLARVETETRAHGGCTVRRLHVRIGALSGVEPDLLATAYALSRARTVCEHAELDIESVEVRWACPRCDRTVPPGAALCCPGCDVPARLVHGDEIILDRIEMEVP